MFDFPSGISGFLAQMVIADSHLTVSYVIQSNSVHTDTEWAIESVRSDGVSVY